MKTCGGAVVGSGSGPMAAEAALSAGLSCAVAEKVKFGAPASPGAASLRRRWYTRRTSSARRLGFDTAGSLPERDEMITGRFD